MTHKVHVDHPSPCFEGNIVDAASAADTGIVQTTWTFPNASYDALATRSTLARSATSLW
jgi:hypothetical protein